MEQAGKKTSPFLAVSLRSSAMLALVWKSHIFDVLPIRTKTHNERYTLSSWDEKKQAFFSLPSYFFSLPMNCTCLWWKWWTRPVQWYIQSTECLSEASILPI